MSSKYLSSFWRTLEKPLINCELNLILTWSANCVISERNRQTTFTIIDTKLYVPVVTLSTQDNTKLLQQLKSAFKRIINWNKYQSKESIETQNPYLDFKIDPNFQGVNRLFVLSFESNDGRTPQTEYFLPEKEMKYYNIVISGQNFFDQPAKNDLRTYNNIQKIATGQGDDYTTGCLLDHPYFK